MADLSKVASNLPENMVQGGLMDDFDGVILSARYAPWDYAGKLDHHILAVRLVIKNDEDGTENDAWYSAGDLDSFMPSKDGEHPVDTEKFGAKDEAGNDLVPFETFEGYWAIRVGKKEGLNNNTNWAQFVGAALEANFPKERVSADVRFLEGVHAHFNRIQQKKRAGLVKADAAKEKRGNEVLVITEFKGFTGTAATAGKPATGGGLRKAPAATTTSSAATSAPSTTSAAPATGDLDSKLVAIVTTALADPSAAEGLSKTKLAPLALKSLAPADKGKGVKRITDADFLNSVGDGTDGKPWAFDAESGTLFNLG